MWRTGSRFHSLIFRIARLSKRICLDPRERESRAWGVSPFRFFGLLGVHVNDENEEVVRIELRGLPRLIGVPECHAIKVVAFPSPITCVRCGQLSWRTGAGFWSLNHRNERLFKHILLDPRECESRAWGVSAS